MRTFPVAILALLLTLHVGCASAPMQIEKMTRKHVPSDKAAADFLTARQLERQDKLERARQLYEELLDKDTENPEYMHRLAVVCTRLQRYGKADSLYARARKIDPKNASLLADMGYSSYLRCDYVDAERLLRDSLHQKPTDKRTIRNLALVVGRQGKMDECQTLLKQLGSELDTLTSLAYIYSLRGEDDLAEEKYREALVIDPNQKDAMQAIAQLSKRRAKTESIESKETPRVAAIPESPFETSPIQQASAVADANSKNVTTANFVEEQPKLSEPGRLPENNNATLFASFDETDTPQKTRPQKTAMKPVLVEVTEVDDWSQEDVATPKSSKNVIKKKSSVFDEPAFDESANNDNDSIEPSLLPVTQSADQLSFGPRQTRRAQAGKRALKAPDEEFEAPAVTADPFE